MNRYIIAFSLLAIAGITIIISFFTLFSQSIRLDESQSLWVSTKPVASILSLDAKDVLVPLYSIILHFWLQFFGTSVIAARVLSLIFLIATIPVLFILYREASNDRIALISTLAFSLSPFVIWYGNETRMYALFTCIAALSNVFFLRMVRSDGLRGKLGYFMSTVIGFYTHYFFVFLVITQMLYLCGAVFLRGVRRSDVRHSSIVSFRRYRRLFFIYFGVVFLAIIFFLPWGIYVIRLGAAANTQPLIPPPTSFNIFQAFVNFIFGFQPSFVQAIIISLWPLLVMVFFFIFTRKNRIDAKNIEYFVVASFLPIALVYVASYIKPIFLSRYLIFTTPSLFFLLIWILMSYSRKISAILVSFVLLVLFGLMMYQNISTSTPVKEDYHDVASYLNTHAGPSDIVAVTPPFTIYPIEYYYTGNARLSSIPQWDRYSQGPVPAFSLSGLQKQLHLYKTQYNSIYIIFSYDQGYQKIIEQYMDTHYQRLVLKKYSPGLELHVYRLRYDVKTSLLDVL